MKKDQYIEIIKRLARIENLLLVHKCSCKDAVGHYQIDAPSNPNFKYDRTTSIFKSEDEVFGPLKKRG